MKALKILIVDDDDLLRWSLFRFLTHAGHEVATATDGLEALAVAAAQHFDFVITDLSMPKLDGWKLLEKLMKFRHPPRVIVMTAQEGKDNYTKVMERGGWGYVEKTHLLDGITEVFSKIPLETSVT